MTVEERAKFDLIIDALFDNTRLKDQGIQLQGASVNSDGSLRLSVFAPDEKRAHRLLEEESGCTVELKYMGADQYYTTAHAWNQYSVSDDGYTLTIITGHASATEILSVDIVKENSRGVTVEVTARCYKGAQVATLHMHSAELTLDEPLQDRLVKDATACPKYEQFGDDLYTRRRV